MTAIVVLIAQDIAGIAALRKIRGYLLGNDDYVAYHANHASDADLLVLESVNKHLEPDVGPDIVSRMRGSRTAQDPMISTVLFAEALSETMISKSW